MASSDANVLHLLICLHNDHSSIEWIIEHQISLLKDFNGSLNIHILNSAESRKFNIDPYQRKSTSSFSIFNHYTPNYSLIQKLVSWFRQTNPSKDSLIWLHPADQISILDINFISTLVATKDKPQVYSGFEFFIHKRANYSVCSSSRNKLHDSYNFENLFYTLGIQSVWWEVFNYKSFEILISLFDAFSNLANFPEQSKPVIIELFLAFIFSRFGVRERIPMLCFYDVERSDVKNVDTTKRTLVLPEIIGILKSHPENLNLLNTTLNRSLCYIDAKHETIDAIKLLNNVAAHSQLGYGKFYHQQNVYVRTGNHRQPGIMLSDKIWAFNLDFILFISRKHKDSMPNLSPCPLSDTKILDLLRKTPKQLWC